MRHVESELQKSCVKWFKLQYPEYRRLLFAVPNGGRRNLREAIRLKAEGVVAGVSDLILLLPNGKYHALCIEMKTDKGRQQDTQKEFQKDVEKVGYRYIIIRSLEEFIKELNQYLKE